MLLEKHIDGSSNKCLSYISSAFKVDNEQRSNQAKDLADSIRTEIHSVVSEVAKDYSAFIKKSTKDLKKLNKDYSYFEDNYQRAKDNYTENDTETKELFITKSIYRFTSEFTLEKKNKLVAKYLTGYVGRWRPSRKRGSTKNYIVTRSISTTKSSKSTESNP